MRSHTSLFKDNIKQFGRELDSIITYEDDGNTIELGNEDLNSITPHFESALLKSAMRGLDIDSNEEIPVGTEINYQFGVKVGYDIYTEENIYEYIDFGNYIVKEVEKQEDTDSYKIIAYDYMLKSMKDYEPMEISYPITIRNYINAICTKLGITFANASDTFANYDKEIPNELYLDEDGGSLGYTFRDVLDELAEVTASIICINEDNELEVRYINNTNDTIDEEYLKNINVNFGEKFGAVNTIVLSRAGGADSIYYPDVVPANPVEIKIEDNQIMNFNNRAEFMQDIYTQLNGLEYYINDFASTGICYYDIGDKYTVSIDGTNYTCIMFNDEINITQGLEENVHTDMPEETNTDYSKSDKTDVRINQTYIIANKQAGQIEALTSRVTTLETTSNDTYTKEQIDQLLIDAENGVTNTFSEIGGNNIFRNTGLWFETTDANNPYEFWTGIVKKMTENNAVNNNALLLQNGTLEQEQEVKNGTYTISFKYKKLVALADCSVIINDNETELTETEETEFEQTIEVNARHINIKFVSDTNDACEIYDLIVNTGDTKFAYSQNQNETTTDTVNISKGITITTSNLDVTFKANADGIRTVDKNGNIKTEFTDTGLKTKEATIENSATITGILFQKVGNHVWLTKI